MKCGLVSLALLGSPVSGCWLHTSIDGRTTEFAGRNWANAHEARTQEDMLDEGSATSARLLRVSGKRALAEACSDDARFSECSQDKGSAIRLERCLNASGGDKVSLRCRKGLQTWKQLLADTAPAARNKGPGPFKKTAKKALARAARVQAVKDRTARHAEGGGEVVGIERERVWPNDDDDWVFAVAGDPHPPHHGHPHRPHQDIGIERPSTGLDDYLGLASPFRPLHKDPLPHRPHKDIRSDSAPIELEYYVDYHGHPHHGDPHHAGDGGHPPHHGMGPPPHHHRRHHHHHHGPPPDFLEGGFLQHQDQEKRPTVFSILADWIFGDYSSSDPLDSSSSSDSWSLDSSSSSSSSSDGDKHIISSSSSSSSTSGGGTGFVDAGFFPAGYGFDFQVQTGFWDEGDEGMASGVELPRASNPFSADHRLAAARGKNLRGGGGSGGASGGVQRSFDDQVYPPPQRFGGFAGEARAEPALVEERRPFHPFDEVPDDAGFFVDGGFYAEPFVEGAISGDFVYAGYGADSMEEPSIEPAVVYGAMDEAFTSATEGSDPESGFFPRASTPRNGARGGGVLRQADGDAIIAAKMRDIDNVEEREWQRLAAFEEEEGFPMLAGGPHGHSKHHHHRGDHIRFRNRLPESFENQRAWLSESFDEDGNGPDLVEGLLALFFFIGAFTLMLLPFFLLGRALKRLVRSSRGGGGDNDDAPDGYYALPEDATAAAAAAGVAPAAAPVSADDDDSIVVTGTPVNPPPSVHL